MIAAAALSLSREPSDDMLSIMILFAVFTASSALPLDWGYSADDKWCFTPCFDRNDFRAVEVNCGPPSVLISSGIP